MKTQKSLARLVGTSRWLCWVALTLPLSAANPDARMAAPVKSPWQSVQRTAAQTRWQSVVTVSNKITSKVSYRTNSFVELGAGLNITNAQGQFISANPSFIITPNGAEARGGAHQVIVPGDIGAGTGVKVITPGGEELVFQPLAIDYFDPVDGQGVLLDVVTNATGWLVASNEIVFSNCFTHIKASIRLRNTRAGLESDLILHESPPEPSAFGLSSSARLEMLTEQLAGPVPVQRASVLREERDPVQAAAMLEPDLVDTELTYGQMKMGAGRAFATPATTNLPPAARSSRVAKSYLDFENRKIVIEAVEHRRVRPALLLLPPATNGTPQASLSPLMKAERLAKNTRRLPAWPVSGETREAALRNKKPQPVQQAELTTPVDATASGAAALGGTGYQPVPPGYQPGGTVGRADESAKTLGLGTFSSVPSGESPDGTGRLPVLPAESPAFVLDYYLVGIYGENNFTFRSDTTYWVSCSIGLSGTTTIEGGTVIKFSEASGLFFFQEYDLVCDTTDYLPAVFTSYDDNSVGEDIGGSGSPAVVGTYGLYFISGGSRQLSNVRFTWLSNPLAMEGGGSANDLTLRNVQVRKSDYVIDSGTTDISIYNGLFVDSGMLFSYVGTFVGEHLTVHNATTTALGGGGTEATIKNSLFVKVASPSGYGSYNISSDTASLSSDTGVFTTVEGGAHYLVANSAHRNAGTASINAQLLASLPSLTTYAPEAVTGTLTTDRTLSRRAIRDTDTPDRGYHYPAVDYLAKNLTVQNATLNLKNGVVVAGGFNSSSPWLPALQLAPGKLISQGTATSPNRLLRASQVQENVQERGNVLVQDGPQDTFKPELTLRFTELSSLADETYLIAISQDASRVEISHSSLLNGNSAYMSLYGGSLQIVGLTNNLFRRVQFNVAGSSPANFYAYNNLFKDGAYSMTGGNAAWRIYDNSFDHSGVSDDASPAAGGKNAYVATANGLSFDTTPVTLTSLTYASGPLGRYYISGTTLQNAGSRNADNAGLYHFTTTTSQSKEQATVVDIGLHYVAVGGTGNQPIDTDGEGLADYLEDQNGDGTVNATETSFLLTDTDGDKLPDFYELELGYDPLVADTGHTGVLDGDKDFDGDGLSNAGEINIYLSNPGIAKSLNATVKDGHFKFAASASLSGPPSTEANLLISFPSGGNIRLTLSDVPSGSTYDIYQTTALVGNSLWESTWSRLYQGTSGQRVWNFSAPSTTTFFMAGSAADTDNDGLTDGYEVLISKTIVDNPDSDGDGSPDGWEVQVGSNPNSKKCPRGIYEDVIVSQSPSRWFKLNGSLADSSGTVNLTASPTSNNYTNDSFFNVNAARWFNGTSHRLVLSETDDPIGGGSSDAVQQGSFALLFRALPNQVNVTREHYLLSQGTDFTANNGDAIAAYFATSGDLKLRIGPVEQVILNRYEPSDGVANDVVYGAWYYLAVTCDESLGNNEAHWYLGRVGSQTLQSGSLTLGTLDKFGNNGNITIGNNPGFNSGYSDPGRGFIHQVAFWRRELTSSEVSAQFNALSPSSIPASFLSGTPAFFYWNLLLPVTGLNQLEDNDPLTPTTPATLEPYTISTGWMNSGFKYVDPADCTRKYFYRNGSTLVFETPWNGTVQPDSPRSELRGTKADGTDDDWKPVGTHTLEANCVINEAGTGNNQKVIFGQIHGKVPDKATFTLNYNFPAVKQVSLTYKLKPDGTGTPPDQNLILAENVNINDRIYYKIRLTDDGTAVKIHGEVSINDVPQTPPTDPTLLPYNSWKAATFYFKAGCYYPNEPVSGTAKVTFSSLSATHAP